MATVNELPVPLVILPNIRPKSLTLKHDSQHLEQLGSESFIPTPVTHFDRYHFAYQPVIRKSRGSLEPLTVRFTSKAFHQKLWVFLQLVGP